MGGASHNRRHIAFRSRAPAVLSRCVDPGGIGHESISERSVIDDQSERRSPSPTHPLNGAPTDFWGKLERDPKTTEIVEWHPLIDHCADVAACAAVLLSLPTWRRRLAHFCRREDLDEITCARLAVLAALHDIGKFNLGFQAKGRAELGATAGHVKEAIGAIGKDVLRSLDPLGEWGDGTTGLLVAAICHHGRPYSFHTASYEPALWNSRNGLNPQDGVNRLLAAISVWFPLAFSPQGSNLPENAGFEHAYAGLVMLADWIGSDKSIFAYSMRGEGDRMEFARDAATHFVAEGWLDIDDTRRADGTDRNAFVRIAEPEYDPNPAQKSILDLPSDTDGSITILESETGSGKTEAALARFVTLFSAGLVDGMYFALPTRTAATQMYRRVFAAMQRAFNKPPPVVLAVPGYLRVDDVKGERKLASFEVLWSDRPEDRFRHRAWAGEGPKRYLAGCIVIGTIDQVLLSSLRVGHAHLRATALLRQLLVVDEVHASDAYMTRVLEDVLARHVGAGGHALLLSATLGGEARARLLRPGEHAPPPDFDEAITAPYPLISHRGATEFAVAVKEDGHPRIVRVETEPWLEDPDRVATVALDAARSGAKVLIIKNTVVDCLETQRCLERIANANGVPELLFTCAGAIAPHHARFARADREKLDKALEERFGGDRSKDGCVLVATQTVQQSLDLDADFLLTDLCPMDVLLQRIGRLHRHSRARPSGFETAHAKIAVPANRDLGVLLGEQGKARHHRGLGTVYPDLRALEATWRLLEETSNWQIPEMNRALVERSIHSIALDAISASGGGHWPAHAQRTLGTQRGEARQADLNLVDWTQPYSATTFSDDERVPTRLGDGDRRVHFELAFESPFGFLVNELTVPARWALGVPSAEETAHGVTCAERISRFQYGGKAFVYDRHGLRLWKETHDEIADDDGP